MLLWTHDLLEVYTMSSDLLKCLMQTQVLLKTWWSSLISIRTLDAKILPNLNQYSKFNFSRLNIYMDACENFERRKSIF